MLYFIKNPEGQIIDARPLLTAAERQTNSYTYRADFKSFEDAGRIAEEATKNLGKQFLPVDNGAHTHPRYDVIEAPVVGQFVSKGFNGDYYSVGIITKISHSYRRIEAIDERTGKLVVFWRLKNTASWKNDKTWSLVKGRHNELNPSF